MENIARALNLEIKDLFEFAHQQSGMIDVKGLQLLIEDADESTRKMLLKFMRAVMR